MMVVAELGVACSIAARRDDHEAVMPASTYHWNTKLHDIEMSLRGILRGFGLKVGATMRRSYVVRASAN